MSESFLELFRTGYEAGQRAFNEEDYEAAYSGLAPEIEYHPLPSLLETGVLRGRKAIEQYFRGLREANGWQVESLGYEEAGEGKVIVHISGETTGRTSGIRNTMELFELLELNAEAQVFRMRDYETREAAVAAAGAAEAPGGD